MFGLDWNDGLAVAVGAYLTKNIGALLGKFVPGVAASIDGVRPGLSTGVLEIAGAWATGALTRQVAREYTRSTTLGGTAIATSDLISALAGQVNLIGGSPSFASFAPRSAVTITGSNQRVLPGSTTGSASDTNTGNRLSRVASGVGF